MNNNQEKTCYFCENNMEVDYKDVYTIRKFTNSYKKILSKKRTGVCSGHQRKLSTAIKRARIIALLPFINK